MRLRDTIQVLDSGGAVVDTLQCQITMDKTQAELTTEQGVTQVVLTEIMSVILKPSPYASAGRRWRWRDREYVQRADPRVRRRNGRDHHYTIELIRG